VSVFQQPLLLFIRLHQFNEALHPRFNLPFRVGPWIVHVALEDQHGNALVPLFALPKVGYGNGV
jgi:hypothetical protein